MGQENLTSKELKTIIHALWRHKDFLRDVESELYSRDAVKRVAREVEKERHAIGPLLDKLNILEARAYDREKQEAQAIPSGN